MSEREDFEAWEKTGNPVAGVGAKLASWAGWQARAARDKRVAELEAELATEKARADAAVGDANEAEAELAEALRLLKEYGHWSPGVHIIHAFLARNGDKS